MATAVADGARRRSRRCAAAAAPRLVVGIGEFAVSNEPDDVIVTHALGSCIAVCLLDPVARVGGLLHFLLPDSRINPGARADAAGGVRRHRHPAAVPDGVRLRRGEEAVPRPPDRRRRGRRRWAAAERVQRRQAQPAGGAQRPLAERRADRGGGGRRHDGPRRVALHVGDGRVHVTSGRDLMHEL